MNRIIKAAALSAAIIIAGASAIAQVKEIKTRTVASDGTVTINTTVIGSRYEGFGGAVPVTITLRKGKVVRVTPLPNRETPDYFYDAETLLESYKGLTVEEALNAKVDAVSGATYSSEALIGNVREGLKYEKAYCDSTGRP